MYVELLVGNESGTKVYQPVVQEGIEWSTERKNTPGKLVFKVLYDNILDFSEGSPVRMKVDGGNVFFGMILELFDAFRCLACTNNHHPGSQRV